MAGYFRLVAEIEHVLLWRSAQGKGGDVIEAYDASREKALTERAVAYLEQADGTG